MSSFTICCDTSCDLTQELMQEWNLHYITFHLHFEDGKEYSFGEIDEKIFYDKLREGALAKTSAPSVSEYRDEFEKELKNGQDVLFVGFSSGLSSAFSTAHTVLAELQEEYPQRKILAVDSLSASAGYAYLLYLTKNKRDEGATIEETAAYAEEMRFRLNHWFTVDDLATLKRGGRLSAAVAAVGSLLKIKPMLNMDNEGHLIFINMVRGRKLAVRNLCERFEECFDDSMPREYFISNGDCPEDVELLKSLMKERCNAECKLVTTVCPTIGSHTGPAVLSLFFIGKNR